MTRAPKDRPAEAPAPRSDAAADPNRRAVSLLGWLRRGVPPLLVLVTGVLAWFALQGFDFQALQQVVRQIPLWLLLVLQALALIAVFEMVLYDLWLARRLKVDLPPARLVRYSWVANTMNNLIGLSGLAGSGIRILLLTRDGVATRLASLYSGVIMLAVPVGLSVLVLAALALGETDLAPSSLPRWAVNTVLIVYAAYLPVFLAVAASRAILHRVLSGEIRLGWGGGLTLVGISVLDWLLAVLVAWGCLAAAGAPTGPEIFLTAFTFAATLGIMSLIPGGIGVFDASLLVMLTAAAVPAESAAAGLLIFRLVYYVVPWVIGLYLGSGLLGRREGPTLTGLARHWQDNPLLGLLRLPLQFIASLGVRLLGLLIFATGLVLLASAALPGVEDRVEHLLLVLPLPALELSHFLSVGVGVLLIALSRGIDQQVRSAYQVAMPLLLAGALLSLLKGAAAGQALFLLTVAGSAVVTPRRLLPPVLSPAEPAQPAVAARPGGKRRRLCPARFLDQWRRTHLGRALVPVRTPVARRPLPALPAAGRAGPGRLARLGHLPHAQARIPADRRRRPHPGAGLAGDQRRRHLRPPGVHGRQAPAVRGRGALPDPVPTHPRPPGGLG